MCGRFAQSIPLGKMTKIDLFDEVDGIYSESYNVAPTQNAFVLINHDGKRLLKSMKWGLVPSWAKSVKSGRGLINARYETLAEKPSFRNLFRKKRCIIPVTGFFEWSGEADDRTPYFINSGKDPNGEFVPMLLCGLYDKWVSPAGEELLTFTIITTESFGSMKSIHNRMPLIVSGYNFNLWLGDYNHERDSKKITEETVTGLQLYPVAKYVNSPKNNSAECIQPAGHIN